MNNRTSVGTAAAVALIKQGLTPYAAAKKAGIALSTIYRHLKKDKLKREKK